MCSKLFTSQNIQLEKYWILLVHPYTFPKHYGLLRYQFSMALKMNNLCCPHTLATSLCVVHLTHSPACGLQKHKMTNLNLFLELAQSIQWISTCFIHGCSGKMHFYNQNPKFQGFVSNYYKNSDNF